MDRIDYEDKNKFKSAKYGLELNRSKIDSISICVRLMVMIASSLFGFGGDRILT